MFGILVCIFAVFARFADAHATHACWKAEKLPLGVIDLAACESRNQMEADGILER
jgi:hypothetical protein